MTMPLAPLVSIIIPVFNKWDMTRPCLESVRTHVKTERVEIIVVDNCSTDETPGQCPGFGASLFEDKFHYLRNESNRGFAKACNTGARESRGEFLLFLNNDTLLANDIIPPLLDELGRKNVGCCGPILLYPTDRIQHMGIGFLHSKKCIHMFRNFPQRHRVTQKRMPLQAISAAVFMIPAALFDKIEGFHEGYTNGYEDLDLCYQVKKLGLKSTIDINTFMYHLEGQSSGRYDHEHENFKVYEQRVNEGYDTDVDIIARVNDMDLVINEWFEPYYIPNHDIHTMYNDEVQKQGLETAVDILEKDPCWEAGYCSLISFFLNHKMYENAFSMALDLFKFCPSLGSVNTLIDLSKRIGSVEDIKLYVLQKQIFLGETARPELPGIARGLQARARRQGRQYLENVLAQWIARHDA